MGMQDESWCASCGEGMHYTPDEDANCGKCEKDFAIDFIETQIAYMANHLEGLEQALQDMGDSDSFQVFYLEGAIEATDHLLSQLKDKYQNA
jgi:hypothetical protein